MSITGSKWSRTLPMFAVAILVTADFSALAEPPMMKTYEDNKIKVDIPQGWQTSWILKEKMLLVDQDPSDSESAGLLIRRTPGVGSVDRASIMRFLDTILDGRVRELSSAPLSIQDAETIRYNDVTQDAIIQLVSIPDVSNQETIVVFFFATATEFERLSGPETAFQVATSILEMEALSTSPAAAIGTNGLIGTWEVSTKDVNLFTGPVSVALGGAATQARITSSLGQSAWGTKLIYQFGKDGKFRATYKGFSVFGVMRSEIEATETGTFRLQGNTLTLAPDRYTGTISVGHQANTEQMNETRVRVRRYKIGIDRNAMALIGPCADYQVEPYCGTSSKPNSEAVFPLKRRGG